ncbi:MAG: protein kinase [Lachnospiraceae bacterium]|nr:protein kinase [Lachnospiraceae bacterium]
MRVSLPSKTMLSGKKSKYEVLKFLSISDRSISVIVKDDRDRKYRLKLYDGDNSVNGDLLEKCLQTGIKGIVRLVDTGSYENRFFTVLENYPYKSLAEQTVSSLTIRSVIIPQILFVMHAFHERKVVLRDIAPEHILFDPDTQTIYYSGFGNLLYLGKKAEYLREPGYGQKGEYIAPEVEKRGYGVASDYFSLGITLLNVLKGKNVFENISRDTLYNELKSGRIPGVDIDYLRNTTYDRYSLDDKLYYLILGLLLPDPDNRWAYGEVRCLLNDVHIPIVRKNGRIDYKYYVPFVINGISCFNDRMIVKNLAENAGKLTDADLDRLISFLKKHAGSSFDPGLIPASDPFNAKVFKLIYAIDPTTDGFYWNNRFYADTDEFAAGIRKNPALKGALGEILKYDCFSYYASCRKKAGITVFSDISEIRGLEELEKREPGEGAGRCLMLFTKDNSRTFKLNGQEYKRVSDLVSDDPGRVSWLKQNAAEIMKNESFKAWLWARGMEKALNEAQRRIAQDPDRAFIVFLTICEACADNDEEKKKIRKIFLKFGDLSPIVWLISNVRYYKVNSLVNKDLYERFMNASVDTARSIAELHDSLSRMVSDYQLFVQNTIDNPYTAESTEPLSDVTGFYPMYESGYFCLKWKGRFEVCPAFLRASGERIKKSEVEKWLDEGMKTEGERIDKKISSLRSVVRPGRTLLMEDHKKRLILSTIVMILTLILMIVSFPVIGFVAIIAFAGSLIWFFVSLSTCYSDRVRLDMALADSDESENQRMVLTNRKNSLKYRKEDILQGIMSGKNVKCRI